jgi:hypothetical protein
LGFEELMCQLRQSFLTQWKEHWNWQVAETGSGHFWLILENSIDHIDYSCLSQRMQCAVARLRLGHVGVGTNFRFGMAQNSTCSVCHQEDTILHFMLACVKFAGPRAAFNSALASIGVPWNLNTALGAEIPAAHCLLVFFIYHNFYCRLARWIYYDREQFKRVNI